jgi:hypothetical protein
MQKIKHEMKNTNCRKTVLTGNPDFETSANTPMKSPMIKA